jgi:DnaJ-class molecular chaperone
MNDGDETRAKEALARFHQPEQPCPECGGYKVTTTSDLAVEVPCPRCHGTGTIPPEQPCPTCDGERYIVASPVDGGLKPCPTCQPEQPCQEKEEG